jgi:hypothetical protein
MTCAHVLGLIDAGDFADYPRAHLDAAWGHARQCPTCGPALEAARTLPKDLATLPQVLPAGDLRAGVLARIAQIERTKTDPATAALRLATARSWAYDWWGSVAMLGGFAASLAIVLASAHGETALFKAGWPGLVVTTATMPSTARDTLMLAGAAALYIASMFAPLRSRS